MWLAGGAHFPAPDLLLQQAEARFRERIHRDSKEKMKSLKQFINFRSGVLIASALGVGLFLSGAAALSSTPPASPADAQDGTAPKINEESTAQSEIGKVAERLPDQAGARVVAGSQFARR